jgi:SNF2 family DNA or RNA helicase
MQVISNFLCFKCNEPEKVLSVIPDARAGGGYAGVPFNLKNSIILKNLGYSPPSPIQTYDPSGRYTPRIHQQETMEFFTLNKRAYCLDDLGTGKTLAALWSSDYLKSVGVIRKVLILSPLSTLHAVWADTLFLDFPHRTWAVVHGSAKKRKEILAKQYDYYIINHHGVEIVKEVLKQRNDIDLIIIDEVAVYRNSQTDLWKAIKGVIAPDKWVWGLTGSPTPQAPTDAYGIMKLITPENYNGSFSRLRDQMMYKSGLYKWLPRPGSEEFAAKLLSPSIRHILEECMDMPDTVIQYRDAALSRQQQKHYDELVKQAVTSIGDTQVSAVNAAVLINKLIQAGCGVIYGENGVIAEMDFGPRLEVVTELIDSCKEKVLLAVPFTGALHCVKEKLQKSFTCEIIEGATPAKKRGDIIRRFQNDTDPRVLLLNPATVSHGVNLTAASMTIWYAPIYRNETYMQFNARMRRPGQKNKMNLVHIQGTPTDKRVYAALQTAGRMQQVVLDLIRENK